MISRLVFFFPSISELLRSVWAPFSSYIGTWWSVWLRIWTKITFFCIMYIVWSFLAFAILQCNLHILLLIGGFFLKRECTNGDTSFYYFFIIIWLWIESCNIKFRMYVIYVWAHWVTHRCYEWLYALMCCEILKKKPLSVRMPDLFTSRTNDFRSVYLLLLSVAIFSRQQQIPVPFTRMLQTLNLVSKKSKSACIAFLHCCKIYLCLGCYEWKGVNELTTAIDFYLSACITHLPW